MEHRGTNLESEFGVAIWLGSIALAFGLHFLFHKKSTNSTPILDREVNLKKQRKEDFLLRSGGDYGYRDSPAGFIDDWRKEEFPHLIAPFRGDSLEGHPQTCYSKENEEVYLDYAGSSLPGRSLLDAIHNDAISSILANPHSSGPAASRSQRLIEEAKKQILDHFNGHPGRFATVTTSRGLEGNDDLLHPGYDIVFTSGTTEALRIVAEHFPWSNGTNSSCKSILLYPHNAHTSVIGMRGSVLAKEGTFLCRNLNEIMQLEDDRINLEETMERWAKQSEALRGAEDMDRNEEAEPSHNLLVFPMECNFGGDRVQATTMLKRFRRLQEDYLANKKVKRRWSTMLDLAKASSTGTLNLKQLDPDFACVSFYKIFGAPTGIGALFVRRSAVDLLVRNQSTNKSIRRYFGGGSVDVVLSGEDFAVGRNLGDSSSLTSRTDSSSSLASLVHGTMHFRGVAALRHGFDELKRVGGMKRIQAHTESLARELCRRLLSLEHNNRRPVIVLYGAWGEKEPRSPGPVLAFNILRSDGTVVGYNEVAKLSALHQPPLQLRTGCFCNPGACQEALKLTDEELIDNYTNAGHVCSDSIDVVNGKPVGALRVSLGKDSLWEDLDALVLFIENHFVNSSSLGGRDFVKADGPTKAIITEMFIYPIKSCGGQAVSRWNVSSPDGRLQFDREFALVDSFGTAMRLQRYPKMGSIRPEVDLKSKTLKVSAPNMQDLVVRLDVNDRSDDMRTVVSVCGNKCCGRVWGDVAVAEWFSSYLGVQCWLARYSRDGHYVTKASGNIPQSVDDSKPAFSNDKPILLISKNAVDTLNAVLRRQNQPLVSSRHFRPNLVIDCEDSCRSNHNNHPEDSWKAVEVVGGKAAKFVVEGLCPRCSMVDVDPTTGTKGKTLRALAEYRRNNSDIHFGIFLQLSDRDVGTAGLECGSRVVCL